MNKKDREKKNKTKTKCLLVGLKHQCSSKYKKVW